MIDSRTGCPDMKLDPPESKIIGICAECDGEIYAGEYHYKVLWDMVHEGCIFDYVKRYFVIP